MGVDQGGDRMRIVAWVYLAWVALTTLGGPFVIGKGTGTVRPADYVLTLVRGGLGLALCGRVLEWW